MNAYLPLLNGGLLARHTDLITLREPWKARKNPWVLGVLVVLLTIEMTVDKIPAVDILNDAIQTMVRPVAGAILFAASSNVISDVNPALAMICGLLVAGGAHAAKATARPAIIATTAGVANPVVSVAKDVGSAVTAVMSVVLAALAALVVVLVLGMFAWWCFGSRRRRLGRTWSAATRLPGALPVADGQEEGAKSRRTLPLASRSCDLLELYNVGCLQPLGAGHDAELDPVALIQVAEAAKAALANR